MATEKKDSELMTPSDVEREFLIPISTQTVWRCHDRYGWKKITIKLGRKIVYRRSTVEDWITSRTGMSL
jgi:hypothetical protein